jgi:hypothetical protein
VALCVLSVALISHFFMTSSLRPPSNIAPTDALSFARSEKISGNVLNSGEFGGYLIFEGVKTFVDGRGDQLFDNAFLAELSASKQPDGDEALKGLLKRYDITWALLRAPDVGSSVLMDRQPNFRRVFQDKDALVYLRTN